MVRNFHEGLKSRWFFVDIVEGLVVVVVWFVLLLGELLHSSIPLFLYVVEGSVDFSFSLSLFAGIVVFLFALSLVFGDFPVGRGGGGWRCKGGSGFPVFEPSLVGDAYGEGWW